MTIKRFTLQAGWCGEHDDGEYVKHADHVSEVARLQFDLDAYKDTAAAYVAALERIKELEARLEIDPRHPYDGIACRDETIRLLEAELATLRANARNAAIDECIALIPGGSYCDPQQIADALRGLQSLAQYKP